MSILDDKYMQFRQSAYRLEYFMVFTTKRKEPFITVEMGNFMLENAARLCEMCSGKMISGSFNENTVRLLVSLPPQKSVSDMLKNLKTQLSRRVRSTPAFFDIVLEYLTEDSPIWSDSYFVETIGSVSEEAVAEYIEMQKLDDAKNKYRKRSPYWDQKKKKK